MLDLGREGSAAIAEILGTMDAPAIGAQIGRHAVEVVPELAERGDKDLLDETIAAATSNVEAVIRGFASGEPPAAAVPPDTTLAWVSTLVHRGIGLAAVIRCYVVGQALCDLALRDAARQLDAAPEVKWDLAGAASQYLFDYVEKVLGDLAEHYERERERWVRGADSIRTELVLDIVEGRPFDPASASATLRYELERPHVALVLWSEQRAPEPPPAAAFKAAAAAVSRALGGTDLLVLPAATGVLWAWVTGPAVTDVPVSPISLDGGLSAALGSVGNGPEGFVRSHREAREARRVAALFGRAPGAVIPHRTVALRALLTRDATAAQAFVDAELGPLGGDDDTSRRLRATLRAFLDEAMSWGRAAKRLGVHQNTVIYRVRQAESLLGHKLTERRLELEAALRLADAREAPPSEDA